MAEPAPARHRRLWIILIVIAVIILVVWLIQPAGNRQETASGPPVPQSTDWVAEPEGPHVPVTVPEVPMTNTPATDAPG